jgi:hypothetical protein
MTEQPSTLENLEQQVFTKKQKLNSLNVEKTRLEAELASFNRDAGKSRNRGVRQERYSKAEAIQQKRTEIQQAERNYRKSLKARNKEKSRLERQERQQKGPKRSKVRRAHTLTPEQIKAKKIIPSFIMCELNPDKKKVQHIKDYALTIPTFHRLLNVALNFQRVDDERGMNSLVATFSRESLNKRLNTNAITQAKVFESLGGNLNNYSENTPFLFTTPEGHLPKPPGVLALDEIYGKLLLNLENKQEDIFMTNGAHNEFFYKVLTIFLIKLVGDRSAAYTCKSINEENTILYRPHNKKLIEELFKTVYASYRNPNPGQTMQSPRLVDAVVDHLKGKYPSSPAGVSRDNKFIFDQAYVYTVETMLPLNCMVLNVGVLTEKFVQTNGNSKHFGFKPFDNVADHLEFCQQTLGPALSGSGNRFLEAIGNVLISGYTSTALKMLAILDTYHDFFRAGRASRITGDTVNQFYKKLSEHPLLKDELGESPLIEFIDLVTKISGHTATEGDISKIVFPELTLVTEHIFLNQDMEQIDNQSGNYFSTHGTVPDSAKDIKTAFEKLRGKSMRDLVISISRMMNASSFSMSSRASLVKSLQE